MAILNLAFPIFECNAQSKFTMGFRLGFNETKIIGAFGPTSKFVPGFHVGPYFKVNFTKNHRMSLDILFSTKGASYTSQINYRFASTQFEYNKVYDVPLCIDLPILYNVKPIAGLYIEMGVQPSIILDILHYNEKYNVEGYGINKMDVAALIGLGYEFKYISFGLRAAQGLANASYGHRIEGDRSKVQLSQCVMATLGVKIF